MSIRRNASERRARRGVSLAWVCLLVIVAICATAGVCAVYLPDRTPALLRQAQEVTVAPVETQDWNETRQVTLTATMSADRVITANSTGMVTAEWSANGLHSGQPAFAVDGRPVIALATGEPMWRDLHYHDTGEDVRALNNELVRLGYPADSGSATYSWNTGNAWAKLLAAAGARAAADGSFSMADTLWIPEDAITVSAWAASPGTQVMAGAQLATVPGRLVKLALASGSAPGIDQTLTVYGQYATLPAGQSEVTDTAFLDSVMASSGWAAQTADSISAGISATLTTGQAVHVLRVPAAAVYGFDAAGTSGCVVSDGRPVHVTVVGSDMGTSYVTATDGTDIDTISTVTVGSSLGSARCE